MSNLYAVIPPTTQRTIVFPLKITFATNSTFDSSFYNPMLTDGRAHLEEVNHVLREIETTQISSLSKMWRGFYCFIAALMVAVFVLTPLIIYAFVSRNFVLAAIAILVDIVLYTIPGFFFTKYVKRTIQNAKKNCLVVVERINQEFSPKGLRWHLPDQFPKWIELWKDYVGEPQMEAPPLYQVNLYPGYENYAVHLPHNQV